MSVVTFDPAAFVAAYPEFTSVDPARATLMFTIAEQSILDNTDSSVVADPTYRTQLFYMLVAHMLLLLGVATPTAPNGAPPGRIASATQGTVTTSFEYDIPSGSAMAPWFNQTKYGALYWMATARFRGARYFSSGHSGIGVARAYGARGFDVPGGV